MASRHAHEKKKSHATRGAKILDTKHRGMEVTGSPWREARYQRAGSDSHAARPKPPAEPQQKPKTLNKESMVVREGEGGRGRSNIPLGGRFRGRRPQNARKGDSRVEPVAREQVVDPRQQRAGVRSRRGAARRRRGSSSGCTPRRGHRGGGDLGQQYRAERGAGGGS